MPCQGASPLRKHYADIQLTHTHRRCLASSLHSWGLDPPPHAAWAHKTIQNCRVSLSNMLHAQPRPSKLNNHVLIYFDPSHMVRIAQQQESTGIVAHQQKACGFDTGQKMTTLNTPFTPTLHLLIGRLPSRLCFCRGAHSSHLPAGHAPRAAPCHKHTQASVTNKCTWAPLITIHACPGAHFSFSFTNWCCAHRAETWPHLHARTQHYAGATPITLGQQVRAGAVQAPIHDPTLFACAPVYLRPVAESPAAQLTPCDLFSAPPFQPCQ